MATKLLWRGNWEGWTTGEGWHLNTGKPWPISLSKSSPQVTVIALVSVSVLVHLLPSSLLVCQYQTRGESQSRSTELAQDTRGDSGGQWGTVLDSVGQRGTAWDSRSCRDIPIPSPLEQWVHTLPGFSQAMLGAIPTLTQGQALHSAHFTLQAVRDLQGPEKPDSSLPAQAGSTSALQCSCNTCSTALRAAVSSWEFTLLHPSFWKKH